MLTYIIYFVIIEKNNEYNIKKGSKELRTMEKKLIGIILLSVAFGMFIAKLVPWWGYIAAFIMGVAGILLIFDDRCL
jgi:F0F1-type ATP synthase assembly protein I